MNHDSFSIIQKNKIVTANMLKRIVPFREITNGDNAFNELIGVKLIKIERL